MSKLNQQEREAYKQATLVLEMSQTKGWQEVFKPQLEAKRDQSFPDPSQFNSQKKFLYAATLASVYKKVIAELLMMVDQQTEVYKHLDKKRRGRLVKKYNIGGE